MKVLPPTQTHDEQGNAQNSFPDDAPAQFVAVRFDGTNYLFYEHGDEVPPDA
jgi:hypothetical protein